MRINLKVAILETGQTQRQIAFGVMAESRLSEIVRGWTDPTEREQELLSEALGRDAAGLFDQSEPQTLVSSVEGAR